MKHIWHGLKHALLIAFEKMRADFLAADATHRTILARKHDHQIKMMRNNFYRSF
jgi:hypothetical protein